MKIKDIEKFKLKISIILNITIIFFMAYGALVYTSSGFNYTLGMAGVFSIIVWLCYFFILKGEKDILETTSEEEIAYVN